MAPIISIVTGTYNRLPSLQRMVASARAQLPVGIPYEFVIVDGGSTDGTPAWCEAQPDVRLIQQGELLGAIRAFDAGAKAAQGDYVLLANDDIEFEPGGIMAAIVHLEQYPGYGAVAFQDNRPAPGYEDGYKIQTMPIIHDGHEVSWPYAQVGLFRRELGNRAGWWGSDDPIMSQGHTYGGDNYLSARLYEMGYTVGVVTECKVTDHLESDGLRTQNYQIEQRNPAVYYKRYPTPPIFDDGPPQFVMRERLRILYFPLYEPGYGKYKRGLRDALARVGLVWEVDFLNETHDLPELVRTFQPHILLMQAHSPDDVPLSALYPARAIKPDMLVVNWNGDVYEEKLTSDRMLEYLKGVDVQLTVNADVLPVYERYGIPAAYWQVGYEPVEGELPDVPWHDVVFLANAYSPARKALGQTLRSLPGVNVGLYGREWAWGNGDTTYNFRASAALYQQASIAVGDNQYGKRGFVSNRIFDALAAGAFLLHQTVPGLEELTGLKAGTHYIEWTDDADLTKKIAYWLKPSRADLRRGIAEAGREYVRTHHSFDARVRQLLLDIVPELQRERV